VLLPAALRALDETDRGVRDARRAAAGETGTLRIAFPASLGLTDVPETVSRFRRENPGVDIELSEATSALQIEYLRSERIDVGFLREEEDVPGLVTERLATEPLVAILPIDHPLGHGRHIEVAALRDEPFVLFPPAAGEAFHRRIVGVCEDAGFRPDVVQEATEWTTIIGLVAAGIGITIAPDSCRALSPRTVAHRPLEPACTTLVVLAWRADHREDPVRDRFVAGVRQQCPLTA
jgi:DNA-binding transcriptional LysR family regulator